MLIWLGPFHTKWAIFFPFLKHSLLFLCFSIQRLTYKNWKIYNQSIDLVATCNMIFLYYYQHYIIIIFKHLWFSNNLWWLGWLSFTILILSTLSGQKSRYQIEYNTQTLIPAQLKASPFPEGFQIIKIFDNILLYNKAM